jgi:hypothetical protein
LGIRQGGPFDYQGLFIKQAGVVRESGILGGLLVQLLGGCHGRMLRIQLQDPLLRNRLLTQPFQQTADMFRYGMLIVDQAGRTLRQAAAQTHFGNLRDLIFDKGDETGKSIP